jgi:hypothetical protein
LMRISEVTTTLKWHEVSIRVAKPSVVVNTLIAAASINYAKVIAEQWGTVVSVKELGRVTEDNSPDQQRVKSLEKIKKNADRAVKQERARQKLVKAQAAMTKAQAPSASTSR